MKKLSAAGYLTLFMNFKLAPMIKTYRSASCHQVLRAILCKYGASYIGTISRSDSDFDETC